MVKTNLVMQRFQHEYMHNYSETKITNTRLSQLVYHAESIGAEHGLNAKQSHGLESKLIVMTDSETNKSKKHYLIIIN
jgi:hypothetical protein